MGKKVIALVTAVMMVCSVLLALPRQQAEAATPGVPVNPNATANAKKVLSYLYGLSDAGFNGVIAGQNLGHGNEAAGGYTNLVQSLYNNTGKWIGMIGLDYEYVREYSASELSAANQTLISSWNSGALITVNFSPTNPWCADIRSKCNGAVDISQLITPGSAVYNKWMSKLDRMAAALQQLRDAGVVVLWRPMQEMNSDWFWWAKYNRSETHAKYIDVWKHMYNYFTNTKGLNNLLWVFSPVGDQGFSSFPYPGADYVDVVAGTTYNDTLTAWGYNDYAAYGKAVGLAEYGPSEWSGANGSFDNRKYINTIRANYPKVAYWVTWHDWTGVQMSLVSNQYEWELMNDSGVITRERINWNGTGGGTGTNLLGNPGFESGSRGSWTDWGNSAVVNNNAKSGTYAMRVGTGAGGTGQRLSSGFAAGNSLTLTGSGKVSASGEKGWIGVKFYNSSGGTISQSDLEFTGTAYATKTLNATVPSGTAYLDVYVWKNAGSGYIYADDISLVKN